MRITFVLPEASLAGGIRVVAIYADRLQRRGHRAAVVSTTPRRPSLRETWRALKRGDGMPRYERHPPSHFDALDLPHHICSHTGPVTDLDVPDADVVIATWWETAEWVWALSPAKGVKLHFMQDYEIWSNQPERVDATCRLPMPKIVIAAWVRDLLREKFAQDPIALIPNAVDAAQFTAPPRGKQPQPTVGLTYTTMLAKGCDISIAAYLLAKQQLPSLNLVAFGSVPPSTSLPLPPDADYTLRAPDDHLPSLYARCDAWLFGTRREAFGLPILEAMACRTPVIGTPGGAAPELLAQGGGILVPHADPAAMADAILRIARLPDPDWQTLSTRAHAIATSYTWEDATTRFEAVLQLIQSRDREGATPDATTCTDHQARGHTVVAPSRSRL